MKWLRPEKYETLMFDINIKPTKEHDTDKDSKETRTHKVKTISDCVTINDVKSMLIH
jgi:hypothetical protein